MTRTSLLILALLSSNGCEPVPRDSAVDDTWSLDLVQVPAGPFWMGCNAEVDVACDLDELPFHEVRLSGFGVLETEVSQAAWQACVDGGSCDELVLPVGAERHPQLPATGVTRRQGEAFCEWAGLRLPTEAQWEKAARGEGGQLYPWGDASPDCGLANGRGCGRDLLPVRSLGAGVSPYGALQMSGNAWEWVSDGYDATYYAESPSDDPTGPELDSLGQLRGVSTYSSDGALRASNRQITVASMTCPLCGVRCVGDLP